MRKRPVRLKSRSMTTQQRQRPMMFQLVLIRVPEASIWDDDAPELTISAGPAVTEGPNVKAVFKAISNVPPKTAIPLQFTPEGEDFITGSGTKVTNYPAVSFEKMTGLANMKV